MTRNIHPILLMLHLTITVAIPVYAGDPLPIEDSDFGAESGWNRDDAVVQLNSFFLRGTAAYEITHEWAAGSPRHQLGYTLPVFSDGKSGFGDAMVSYRYQLAGGEDARFGVAPRFSLILPTRKPRFGEASSGMEIAIPVSVALGERFTSHTNLNATWFRDREETEWKVTQSLGLAVMSNVAFSIEAAYTNCAGPEHLMVVRPGIQFTFDVPGGLRVSPGIGLPLGDGGGVLFSIRLERAVSRSVSFVTSTIAPGS